MKFYLMDMISLLQFYSYYKRWCPVQTLSKAKTNRKKCSANEFSIKQQNTLNCFFSSKNSIRDHLNSYFLINQLPMRTLINFSSLIDNSITDSKSISQKQNQYHQIDSIAPRIFDQVHTYINQYLFQVQYSSSSNTILMKTTDILLIFVALGLVYFNFFHHGHDQSHSKFQTTDEKVLFHSNWTKSLDDVCCLSKFHSALNSQGINTLDVSLSMSRFGEDDLKKIFPIPKFQSYKSIKLDLSGLNITNSGIQYVLELIQPTVQNLELNLNGLQTQPGFGKLLADKLNTLTSLSDLRVSLIMSIKSNEVNHFFTEHKPTSALESFHLILIGNQLNKDSIAHLSEHLGQLKSLENLHLNFYANKLGAEGAEILSSAIKTIPLTLKQLSLDLYFNNITEIGTQSITAALTEFTSLKSLELNLDFNYIKNEGGKAVGKMLEKMTTLESLTLGVASKNFGYLGYKYIVSGLQKLTQLKKLVLRCGINRVGVNGAEITKEMLNKMTELEHLELNFFENYVGDDGISLLAQQVASMQKLKTVYLNLAFNDAKTYGLVKTIKAFLPRSFQSLHLSLSSNEFRDPEVKLIESHLATLIQKNTLFNLDFTDTAISKQEMKKLETIFAETNKKHNKYAKISVNSIIPEENPQEKTKQQPKKAVPQKPTAAQQTEKTTSNATQSEL